MTASTAGFRSSGDKEARPLDAAFTLERAGSRTLLEARRKYTVTEGAPAKASALDQSSARHPSASKSE